MCLFLTPKEKNRGSWIDDREISGQSVVCKRNLWSAQLISIPRVYHTTRGVHMSLLQAQVFSTLQQISMEWKCLNLFSFHSYSERKKKHEKCKRNKENFDCPDVPDFEHKRLIYGVLAMHLYQPDCFRSSRTWKERESSIVFEARQSLSVYLHLTRHHQFRLYGWARESLHCLPVKQNQQWTINRSVPNCNK